MKINGIDVDHTNSERVLAAIDGAYHLAETTNGGTSWGYKTNSPDNLLAITIDPVLPTSLLTGDDIYTYRSSDGGDTWSARQLQSFTDTSDIWVKPDDRTHILVATTDTLARPYGVHLNTQYGFGMWTRTLSNKSLTLASDPNNPSVVYVGTHDNGYVMRSADGGFTWILYSPERFVGERRKRY